MLSEPWHNIDKYYDKDEIILFDSVDEGVDKIKYYESHPDEYEKIFQKGRNALLSRNTAYHEWNRILPQIDKDFQPVDVKKLMETYHKDLL
jgi:spore maturation protein CgeB